MTAACINELKIISQDKITKRKFVRKKTSDLIVIDKLVIGEEPDS